MGLVVVKSELDGFMQSLCSKLDWLQLAILAKAIFIKGLYFGYVKYLDSNPRPFEQKRARTYPGGFLQIFTSVFTYWAMLAMHTHRAHQILKQQSFEGTTVGSLSDLCVQCLWGPCSSW